MRAFFFATTVCFLSGFAIAAEPLPPQSPRRIAPLPSSQTALPKSQIEHLKSAADHLAKAGRQVEADKLREQICVIESGQAEAQLAKKEKELDALCAEVEGLRKLARRMPQISLSLHVLQFSREKLKNADVPNIDRLLPTGDERINVRDSTEVVELLETLREQNLVRILAEPTIITVSGRPARFHSGGEIPTLKPTAESQVSIGYARFGTEVDTVPVLIGTDKVRLGIRVRVTEVDPTRSVAIGENSIPVLRSLEFQTGTEMRLSQTLVLGGLVEKRVQSHVDANSETSEMTDQFETVVLITPRRIDGTEQVGHAPVSGSYIESKTSARPNPTKRAR